AWSAPSSYESSPRLPPAAASASRAPCRRTLDARSLAPQTEAMHPVFRLLPAFFALFSLACEQAAPTGTAPARASASAAPKRVATSGPSARPAGPMNAPLGIQWAAPDGWITQEPNPGDVRRATYVVPKLEGD